MLLHLKIMTETTMIKIDIPCQSAQRPHQLKIMILDGANQNDHNWYSLAVSPTYPPTENKDTFWYKQTTVVTIDIPWQWAQHPHPLVAIVSAVKQQKPYEQTNAIILLDHEYKLDSSSLSYSLSALCHLCTVYIPITHVLVLVLVFLITPTPHYHNSRPESL